MEFFKVAHYPAVQAAQIKTEASAEEWTGRALFFVGITGRGFRLRLRRCDRLHLWDWTW